MRIRAGMVLVAAILAGGNAWSQSRLGDIAGSISLNPAAVVEKDGYVEDPRQEARADRELLADFLRESSTIADRLGRLVEEARSTVLYSDDALPTRMTAAAIDLDSQFEELDLFRLDESLAQPFATAREAVGLCASATDAVRAELDRKGVRFVEARDAVDACRRQIDRAESELAAVGGGSVGEAAPVAAAAGDTDTEALGSTEEIVAVVCASERDKGESAYESCTSRQFRAQAALASRTAANEMIDSAVFDGIRDVCAELHPADFYQRDLCELDKMTTARLELE